MFVVKQIFMMCRSRRFDDVRRFIHVTSQIHMRFVQFAAKSGSPKGQRVGVQMDKNGYIVDLTSKSMPSTMVECLDDPDFIEKASNAVQSRTGVLPLEDVDILPPITHPDKILGVAMNYKKFCLNNNIPVPTEPIIFSKFSNSIAGPYDPIILPGAAKDVDWEVELAVVIGKEGRDIPESHAQDYIFGYTLAQDITSRYWQTRNGGQFLLAKSMDTFCPIGPAIVTKKALNANALNLVCSVNGIEKQCGCTGDMIFGIDYLVSYISQIMTLYPGDLILTGTPDGVGVRRHPPEFLKPGDVVTSKLECIGQMVNKVEC